MPGDESNIFNKLTLNARSKYFKLLQIGATYYFFVTQVPTRYIRKFKTCILMLFINFVGWKGISGIGREVCCSVIDNVYHIYGA